MSQRNSQIQVPERGENEPDATAQQLEFIRQLIIGTSVQGFRFDYRKLGEAQAAAVINQLLLTRDASKVPVNTHTGPGCIGSIAILMRRLGTVVILLMFLAAIGGGVYLYFAVQKGDFRDFVEKMGLSMGEEITGEKQDAPPSNESKDDNLVDSLMFDGLKVPKNLSDLKPIDPREGLKPDNNSTPPSTTDPPPPVDPPDPQPSGPAFAHLDAIELMLVQLSQFTRSDYDQSIRAQSVKAMNNRLAKWSDTMAEVKEQSPELAKRIRDLVNNYGNADIDGPAMREEVNAIRDLMKTLD